eukprot:TRINITY_DN70646_c0_g1_i1.p1 TRINITY_DN70646_c0_g1~~TRINITY_DN70646_c0_g1_i1.p1  ORF type:complete len:259 (+),score=89.09 TRINITY_DN70646_c0_g1_i1:98-778(+)
MAKPERTTLYCKAGPGGDGDLGDCPFAHMVQMALALKGVEYDLRPTAAESKPQWLLDEAGGKMPCVLHQGVPHVESADIMKWADATFGTPGELEPTPDAAEAVRAAGLFPAIAGYTKCTDEAACAEKLAAMSAALGKLGAHLATQPADGYASGARPTLVDCDLAAKLYVLQHATKHFLKYDLGTHDFPNADAVRGYWARVSALPAFIKGKYPEETGIWGWTAARAK